MKNNNEVFEIAERMYNELMDEMEVLDYLLESKRDDDYVERNILERLEVIERVIKECKEKMK